MSSPRNRWSGAAAVHPLHEPGRFLVRRELGRGGMGVVHAALDRERGVEVAVKRLAALTPTSLYRFKREFRALADLAHPNLITLYELQCEDGAWSFTMELIDGVDFVTFVRGARGGRPAPASDAPTGVGRVAPAAPPARAGGGLPDLDRLRASFRQLAEALCALHAGRFLHRDIKPSNVLVTAGGRVVVLDFGVIAELAARPGDAGEPAGTPLYMAPEQAAGQPLSPAADWYGAGVVLYEALTGRRPFEGDAAAVLRAKQERAPVPPAARVPGVPTDLDALCMELLRIDPGERPIGAQVLARLAGVAPAPGASPARLYGRDAHLEVLREAFAAARAGRGQMLLVHGASGVGKSELVRHFVDELAAGGETLVLAGRCFEREAVPWKGIDGLVDALAGELHGLPRAEVEALIPDGVDALARLLPVLRRVEAIAAARPSAAPDPHELRRQATRALRELLTRLALRRPTVLIIDDLQWGDADSGAVLADLMQPPDPPPLLVVGAYRTDEAAGSPLLRALWRREERLGPASRMRRLAVCPLEPEDARALAAGLLGRSPGALIDNVVREADGNPYFIGELSRYAADFELGLLGSLQLADVVLARAARLDDDARRLLDVIAAAGRPIAQGTARAAAGDASACSLETLRGQRLVRTQGSRDRDPVEPFHDRIRESIVAALDPLAARAIHGRLARSLEAAGEGDTQTLGEHWERAGDRARAAGYYERAAATAAQSLAFDRAADLYARVALLRPGSAALEARLGDALANAGRGPAAAAAYRRAAADGTGDEALVLRARAATELLRSGHVDEGLDELTPALAQVGLRPARRPFYGLVSVLARRVRLRLRGLRYRARPATAIAGPELARIDVSWGAACGLAFVDLVGGAEMQTRHLLWALRAGDPYRVGRALICEVGYHAVQGPRAEPRVTRILDALEDAARRSGQPAIWGYLSAGRGLAAYQFGRFREARERGDEAERIFREQCAGAWWELTTTRLYLLWSRYYLGEIAELSRRVPAFLADAEARGDRLLIASLSTGLPHQRWLLADDPDEGERVARAAMAAWSHRSYFLQHFWHGFAESQTHLYRGDGARALARIQRDWPALERSLLLHVALIRVEALHARGRAALAAAAASPAGRAERLTLARLDAARIARIPTPLAPILAELQLAGADEICGDLDGAGVRLRRAAGAARRLGLGLHRRAAEWQLGRLLGGDEGRRLIAEAEAAMRAQEIASPARAAFLLAPGARLP